MEEKTQVGDLGEILGNVAALSPAQNATLTALSDAVEPLTVARIAKIQGVHPNSVRDTLNALVENGLVVRSRQNPTGRGRPSWVYEAVALASLDGFAMQFATMCAAVADYLQDTSTDPYAAARSVGHRWAHRVAKAEPAATFEPTQRSADDSVKKPAQTGGVDGSGKKSAQAGGVGDSVKKPAQTGADASVSTRPGEGSELNLNQCVTQLRMFLSSLGYAATMGQQPGVIELRHCPIRGQIGPARSASGSGKQERNQMPLVCAIHQGVLEGLMEINTHGRAAVTLQAMSSPGRCTVCVQSLPEAPHSSVHPNPAESTDFAREGKIYKSGSTAQVDGNRS